MKDASQDPQCPKCSSDYSYADGSIWICPQCAHEWPQAQEAKAPEEPIFEGGIRDANGNILSSGDSVIVVKELKIKGASSVVKVGTKVKNIRLQEASDGHDIACKIDGIGAINLKSEFVRKA